MFKSYCEKKELSPTKFMSRSGGNKKPFLGFAPRRVLAVAAFLAAALASGGAYTPRHPRAGAAK